MEDQPATAHQIAHLAHVLPINDHLLDEKILALPAQIANDFILPIDNTEVFDEALHNILGIVVPSLDLRTLVDFMSVNRYAADLVNSLPSFRIIEQHAHYALRGILAIETGRFITCTDLFEAICTAECQQCGEFGGYLYLITCRRVCFNCLSNHWRFLPLSRLHACRRYGLSDEIVNTLPCMRPIPGIYSPKRKGFRGSPAILVDPEAA